MRIIAGEFRGRKLLPPKTEATRPITDRVKQSVFDVLSDLVIDATVLDCFAGTGSLGLESLSRGAKSAVFFEMDRSAAAILRRNIAAMKVEARSRVVVGDLFSIFGQSPPDFAPADLIFLDPPYRFIPERPDDLRRLAQAMAKDHLAANGLVIFRRPLEAPLTLPPLQIWDQRTYGTMVVEFLKLV